MSEQPIEGQDATGPAGMPIQILTQYVKDLSFENPNAPQSLLPNQNQPEVSLTVDVSAKQIAEEVFEVELELKAQAKQAEATAFIVELTYGGLFQLPGVPEEHHAPMLLIEGARLLFPFARAIIAAATRDGGYPPLMVNPVDFVDLFRRRVAAAQEAQGEQTPDQPQQPPF
jgi:preprotein translocase subunit SecB